MGHPAADQDEEHATYDPARSSAYFAATTRAALVLSTLRAPYRRRCSPGRRVVGLV